MAVVDRVLNPSSAWKTIIVDVCILSFVYFIPTLSHLTAIPFYYFEPMRIALFVSILFLRDRNNAYILAITLPLFSYLVAGHPVVVKNAIMAIELFVNVLILCRLLDRKISCFLSCFLAILVSKLIYYGLKYTAISVGWLNSGLIDTSVFVQISIAFLLSLLFWVVYYNRNNQVNG